MAIQVNGTTVIDDSRNLSNVGGLKTVGGTSILGSGDIATGGSTTFGAVGTYILAGGGNATVYNPGDTESGSTLREFPSGQHFSNKVAHNQTTAFGLSGTWRYMASYIFPGTNYSANGLWVRIS